MTAVNGASAAQPDLQATSSASTPQEALQELIDLCEDIQHFIAHTAPRAQYRAPIIDWHHADDYAQKDIAGLKKFLGAAESERSYVEGLAQSSVPPKGFTSNTPHILAVWYEFKRAAWPLTSIGQAIEYDEERREVANGQQSGVRANGASNGNGNGNAKIHGKGGKSRRRTRPNVKVDIVCKGGDEWIKVNTMKESRLLQEFREQDSYINSDYDSESDHTSCAKAGPTTPPALSNTIIKQAEALLHAARNVPLLPGRRRPVIRMIFTRLEPLSAAPSLKRSESDGETTRYEHMIWQDERTGRTLVRLAEMGVLVQIGPSPRKAIQAGPKVPLVPTQSILLDLSILVALCCESSHRELPRDEAEHQARFRALRIAGLAGGTETGKQTVAQGFGAARTAGVQGNGDPRLELAPHTNASRDLSDQLAWEAQHPLICELRDRLLRAHLSAGEESRVEFWVTEEVYKRLPGLVDLIGGPGEQARAKALFALTPSIEDLAEDMNGLRVSYGDTESSRKSAAGSASGRNADFWAGSRWQGQEGLLANLRVGILPDTDMEDDISPASDSPARSAFASCLINACDAILAASSAASGGSNTSSGPGSPSLLSASPANPPMRRDRRNRHRPSTLSAHHTTRLPSGHTLRTLMHGASRGWTVLSNNRGAVGKVCREMGIGEGLSVGDDVADDDIGEKEGTGGEEAAVWIVNPSSLSEWRRREVEKENERVKAQLKQSHDQSL